MIKNYVNVNEASKILDVSETTIYRLLNNGLLKFITAPIGNSKIVCIDDLLELKPVTMTNNNFNKNVKQIMKDRDEI